MAIRLTGQSPLTAEIASVDFLSSAYLVQI